MIRRTCTWSVRIDNIKPSVSKATIEAHFGSGVVSGLSLAASANDPSVQVATVTFNDRKAYRKALKLGSNAHMGGAWNGSRVSVDDHFKGLTVLFEPSSGPPVVDIVAVHGLNGHGFETWTYHDKHAPGGLMWLRDLLPEKVQTARIVAYGYNANTMSQVSVSQIPDHARTLRGDLHILVSKRKQSENRPVVLLCHSLGGIVAKQTLIKIRNDQDYPDLQSIIYSIIFLATPHRGSGVAEIGDLIAKISGIGLTGRAKLVKFLKPKANNLHELALDFTPLHGLLAVIVSFYEQQGMPGIGIVVDRQSAVLGIQGERMIPLDADHSRITKFSGNGDKAYQRVVDAIETCVKESPLRMASPGYLVATETAPRYVNIPRCRNADFVQRGQILEVLRGHCRQDGYQHRVVIYGLGGSGKTEIALEFAHRQPTTTNVFWVNAKTEVAFKKDAKEILQIVLGGSPDQNQTEDDMLQAMKRTLENEKKSGHWVLIMDGANDLDLCPLFQKYLPTTRGMIVFTTQNKSLSVKLSIRDTIEVGKMSDEESVSTLKGLINLTEAQAGSKDVKKLLILLGNLPLAIRTASAYIRTNDIKISYFCDSFVRMRSGDGVENESLSFMTTWDLSFKDVRAKSALARDLLRLMAWLDPEEIDKEWLWRQNSPNFSAEQTFIEAFGLLVSYSFIIRSSELDAAKDIYHLHPLVSFWAQARMTADEKDRSIGDSLSLISDVFPLPELENVADCRRFLSHAHTVETHFSTRKLPPSLTFARVLYRMAKHMRLDGSYARAESYALRSKEIYSKHLGETSEEVLDCVHLLAGCASFQKDHTKALELYNVALEGKLKLFGNDFSNPSVLSTVNNVGTVLDSQGKYERALEKYTQALDGRKWALGDNHPDTLSTINNIGLVYYRKHDYVNARKWLELASTERERAEGALHPHTLSTVNNLALVHDRNGDIPEALRLFSAVMKGREKVLGDAHPSTLATYNNIGSAYVAIEENEKALSYFRKALEGRELVLGKTHPATLTTSSHIARVYENQGKTEQAVDCYLSVLKGREEVFGGDEEATVQAGERLLGLYWGKNGHRARTKEKIIQMLGKDHNLVKAL